MAKKEIVIRQGGGQKCQICIHPKALDIAKELAKGRLSYVEIARKYLRDPDDPHTTDQSLSRKIFNHAKNCINKAGSAVINKILEKQGVAVYDEFVEQLNICKEIRTAAIELLTNPDTNEIDLSPHAREIRVHYWQQRDTIESAEAAGVVIRGQRRRKIETLQVLLDKIDEARPGTYDEREMVSIRTVDPRTFALDCIAKVDAVLDKFARMGGLYKADQTNPNDLAIRAAQAIALVRWGVSLANCPETKAAHAKGQNISIEFALSTLDPIRTSEEDEQVFNEMQKQLLGSEA